MSNSVKKLIPLLGAAAVILGQDNRNIIGRGKTKINDREIEKPYAENTFRKIQDKKKLARKNRKMRRR